MDTRSTRILSFSLCLLALLATMPVLAVDVGTFTRNDSFEDIKLSPGGDYFAATVPLDDQTVLAIIRRQDNKVTGSFRMGRNTHVSGFWWVNRERVLISIAEKHGELETPQPTGELYAVNADGSRAENLIGYRVPDDNLSTMIRPKKAEQVAAFLIDDLPNDDRNVLIAVWPAAVEPFTRVEKMDVYTGRRVPVARAPIQHARFVSDGAGMVRLARGSAADNYAKLYYRSSDASEWRLVNDEAETGRDDVPLGFSADGKTAYLQSTHKQGPDSIVAVDFETGERREIVRDAVDDPAFHLTSGIGNTPAGIAFNGAKPRIVFIDDASQEAKLQRTLEASFPGQRVLVTSETADGRLQLLSVDSDRNPGDFYLYDTTTRKASYLLSRRDWLDPERMSRMQPVTITARDGVRLHGFLTFPAGKPERGLPLVVHPHGGPFGLLDTWGFDPEVQLLAQAGYAVLQVNFRGSGGYGDAFMDAGAREWGGLMQDDLTDATRWAIEQGHADPGRVCLYGASYGAYASLMGAAREPGLYKCAAGYVGVYDLPMLLSENSRGTRRLSTWTQDWLGDDREQLAARSPTQLAARIAVPVFLAAGGADEVAPVEHTRKMEKALRDAGVPVETLYYETEGHGFYDPAHRNEYYTRLLAFLARHLGDGGNAGQAVGSE